MELVIFDCDNTMGLRTKEIDDGLTLYYLLGRPDIDLVGITTTFGNGTIEQVFQQTLGLADDLNLMDLPVLKGAGERGEGPTEAAGYLAEMAAEYPGEINLLATGPLGNLRAAQELDRNFFGNLKSIACMGGYLGPVRLGRRDVKELNLSADPEASYQVFNASCPVTLMTAQICLQAPFTWNDLSELNFWSRETRRLVRRWLIIHGLFCGIGNFYLWDLLPAVYLSYPELFNEHKVSIVSTVPDLETGSLVLDENPMEKNVNMPGLIMDFDRFKKILFDAWRTIRV
jgi:inosine-uridine nucleoside N-ribohydrolase